VRNENVDGGERSEERPDLPLLIEELPAGFISPHPVQAADPQAIPLSHLEVQIGDGADEGRVGVVVPLDGEYRLAAIGPGRLENHPVCDVPAGDHEVGPPRAASPAQVADVGQN